MTKKYYLLIFMLFTLIVLGTLLMQYFQFAHDDFEKNITIDAFGEKDHRLSFEYLELAPGDSVEYSVDVRCAADGDFTVSLAFAETEDAGLSPFVNVEISCEGSEITENLQSLFHDGKTADFDCRLYEDTDTRFTIRFTMAEDVGDEAQGAGTKFDLLLTASHM